MTLGAAPSSRAPSPPLVVGLGAIVLAFAADHPAVLAALAAGGLTLLWASRNPLRALYAFGGMLTGALLVVLTPFVSAEGNLIVVQGPALPPFDTEVTLEELAAGAAAAVRIVAVTALVGAGLGLADPDRLQARVALLAPRSALLCSLAARLLPTLERDARGLADAARLRGAPLHAGSWPARARAAGALAVPLVGSSLERGLDVAEAMTARGFGAGARTRLPEPALTRREWAALACGLALCATAALALSRDVAAFDYYPSLQRPFAPDALAVATIALAALLCAARLLRR